MLPNPWAFASISLAWTKNWLKNFNATFPQLLCAHGMSPVRWDECLRNGIYISHVVLPTSYTYLTDTEFMTRQVLVQLGFRKRLDARWDCLPPSLSPALLLLAPSPFLFLALSLLSLLIWPHSQGGTSVVSHHHLRYSITEWDASSQHSRVGPSVFCWLLRECSCLNQGHLQRDSVFWLTGLGHSTHIGFSLG